MDWQTAAAFLTATAILFLTPGPVMAILVGNTLKNGRAAGLRTVLGIGLGELLLIGALAVSFLYSSRLLAQFFPWLSLLGAAYLLWLAMSTLFSGAGSLEPGAQSRSRGPFLDGLAITLSNPAALLFYSAFFTPFLNRSNAVAEQLWTLSAIYILASLAFDTLCVLFAAQLRPARFEGAWLSRIARLASAAVYLATSLLALTGFVNAAVMS